MRITKILLILVIFCLSAEYLPAKISVQNKVKKTKLLTKKCLRKRSMVKLKTFKVKNKLAKKHPVIKSKAFKVETKQVSVSNKAKGKVAVKKLARVTKYTWTGNRMANGKFPAPGYVAVSDRSIKLGSLLWIGYDRYIVGDYTKIDIQDKSLKLGFDLTVDIYTDESRAEALNFGFEKRKIALLTKD